MVYARTARGQVLSLREQPFVESAVSVGCRTRTIVFSHILPNLSAAILTLATLEMARVILVEAILSFLGMGVEPPDTSLGLIMAEGRPYLTSAWWITTAPGILISFTVFAVNLISSWLRAVADPVQRFQKGASGG
jgi:peptide/nickel transport system permease protein